LNINVNNIYKAELISATIKFNTAITPEVVNQTLLLSIPQLNGNIYSIPGNTNTVQSDIFVQLPDNCTWDDIMHQVYLILTVEAGLADSQAGQVKSIEEVRSQFGLQP
jgi:hypothetical protein